MKPLIYAKQHVWQIHERDTNRTEAGLLFFVNRQDNRKAICHLRISSLHFQLRFVFFFFALQHTGVYETHDIQHQ